MLDLLFYRNGSESIFHLKKKLHVLVNNNRFITKYIKIHYTKYINLRFKKLFGAQNMLMLTSWYMPGIIFPYKCLQYKIFNSI